MQSDFVDLLDHRHHITITSIYYLRISLFSAAALPLSLPSYNNMRHTTRRRSIFLSSISVFLEGGKKTNKILNSETAKQIK